MSEEIVNIVVLDVSDAAYKEIKARLEACGYSTTHQHEGREVLDMQNIALRSENPDDGLTVFLAYKGKLIKNEANNRS